MLQRELSHAEFEMGYFAFQQLGIGCCVGGMDSY